MLAIALGLDNYHAIYGELPPPALYDSEGHAIHSWRALILPYCGDASTELTQSYRFDEPWDGPHNRLLHDQMPSIFGCPSDDGACAKGLTSYFVVVGDETLFPREGGVTLRAAPLAYWDTIMLVESNSLRVNWLEPRDLEYSELKFSRLSWPANIASDHFEGPGVATAERSIDHLEYPPIGLRRLLKRCDYSKE